MVDEKPFPCTSPGCSMRFANEDHLSIHKKRHMYLTIDSANNGNKTPTFIADETPTPTRFIRNCEEVGLFQDLQNVNPFDEQFRRASAEGSTLTSPTQSNPDDALHTPHVFPVVSLDNELPPVQLPPPKSANVRKNYLMPSLSTSECLVLPSPLTTPVPAPVITITAPPESPPTSDINADEIPAKSSKSRKRTSSASPAENKNSNSTKKERARKTNTSPTPTNNKPTSFAPARANIMPRPVVTSPPINDPLTTLLIRLPDGRLVQIPAIPVATDATDTTSEVDNRSSVPTPIIPLKTVNVEQPQLPSNVTPALSEAKMKLKQALTKTKNVPPTSQPRSVGTPPSFVSDTSGTDTEQGVATPDSMLDADNSKSSGKRGRYNSCNVSDQDLDDEESEKRRKFLERNRAAAFRSRQKRKRWVNNLEQKTAAMNTANRTLQNEVVALRSEVAQLKLQLLAHKDCPVTLAMCQPPPIPVNDNNNSRLGISNQANSGILPTTASQVPRQVIFLNQNPAVSKPQPAVAVLNQTPLMMIPGGGGNLTNTAAQPHHKTSVIMSLKMSEK